MSQKRASGEMSPRPDPVQQRVQAAVEAAQAQRLALEKALTETPQNERADALAVVVLDLLQQVQGLTAMLIPMAGHMDALLRWVEEMDGWRAETNGRLLFATPPINRRA